MRSLRHIVPLLAAAALIAALLVSADVTLAEFYRAIGGFSVTSAIAVLACTAAFLLLSSLKWRMVMALFAEGRQPHWGLYVLYTGLGAVLSLVMMPHLAMGMARALGAKYHLGQSPVTAAAASVYEQIFDIGVLMLFAAATVLVIAFGLDAASWIAVAGCLIVAAALVLPAAGEWGISVLLRLMAVPARYNDRAKLALEWFGGAEARRAFSRGVVVQLFLISVTRYLFLLLRGFVVLWAVGLPITEEDFVNVFALVQLSKLVSVTPAGLGVSEWTWSALLVWWGTSLDGAVQFVLVNRAVTSLSLVAFLALVCGLVVTWRCLPAMQAQRRGSDV